jgi:hypothetical protein
MHARQMIGSHPDVRGQIDDALLTCIEQCFDCAQACIACADACLSEEMVANLRQCIRLNLDCADVCIATGTIASRRTGANELRLKQAIELCESVCRACAEECGLHAEMHEHCRVCAETCETCADACEAAASNITPPGPPH